MEEKQHKILVVDDEQNVRILLDDTLTAFGYKVVQESQALSTVRTIKKENPDLITLDLKMPGADGIQIIKTLRRENINIPIVVISAFLGSPEIKQLLDLGVTQILSKPFQIDNLKEKIIAALA